MPHSESEHVTLRWLAWWWQCIEGCAEPQISFICPLLLTAACFDLISDSKSQSRPDGDRTSSEMGRLLREHQRAAQALNNATVREVHDSMRSQIMQLVFLSSFKLCDPKLTDMDRALSSTLRCSNSKKIKRVAQWENRPEGLRLRADLEFSFRSEVLTFHVCTCSNPGMLPRSSQTGGALHWMGIVNSVRSQKDYFVRRWNSHPNSTLRND